MLNYPGSTAGVRNPEFRRVLRPIDADIVVVQEMTSASGMSQFASQVLNVIYPSRYAAVPFNDGPDTDNGLFYDSSRVSFLGALYLPTELRDIAGYTLRVKSSGDTVRIYSLHLKASTGSSNEDQREREATVLRNHLNALATGSLFVVTGDFNIYRSSEPAFQKLIGSQADNEGRCFDQLNLIGNWGDSVFAPHHTQSPRVRSFDGGATGGMDDRFDMILSSDAMRSHLLTSSITAYGNDGLHYNDSINALPNLAVPDSIANALHYASDHIPIFADIVFAGAPPAPPIATTDSSSNVTATSAVLYGSVNPAGSSTQIRFAYGLSPAPTDTTAPQAIGSGSTPVKVSAPLSGLGPDATYVYRVLAANAGGSASGGLLSLTTPPLLPATPLLALPDNGSVQPAGAVTLLWHTVTGAATYIIQVAADPGFTAILAADSLFADTSRAVGPLPIGGPYYWRVAGTNAAGTGPYSAIRTFTVENIGSGQFAVAAGWNLVALPFAVAVPLTGAVYPEAISPAYRFTPATGYVQADTLLNGTGYWLKFGTGGAVDISGTVVENDTVTLHAGWNLVGTVSVPVDTGSVTTIPPGLRSSPFYTYEGGFVEADTLMPGRAYWLKVTAQGLLVILPSPQPH